MALTAFPSKHDQLSEIFDRLGAALDISPDLYELAEARYLEVGRHLARRQSSIASFKPAVFPQGSLRLGTIITPIVPGCEYDVDLVCVVGFRKEAVTQRQLKQLIGAELRLAWAVRLEEKRRCWTLNYPRQFHLDVLPAIPDVELPPTAILLTDKDLVRWQHSDPQAYARWFESRMAAVFFEAKKQLAMQLRVNVADVPDWRVRTPLQRVVQLLKRHRDMFFQRDLDVRPASIIITTLAATLYQGQRSIAQALTDIVEALPKAPGKSGDRYEIWNPVHLKENFADRWNEDPTLARAFLRWVAAVRADVEKWLGSFSGVHQLSLSLAPRFGDRVVESAFKDYGQGLREARAAGTLAIATGTGQLVSSTTHKPNLTRVRPHTFFGDR